MKSSTSRLFFIDVMRAWAILMMLQGHFVDGLLDTAFRDPNNIVYQTWLYFRGITAPVFFTVSGFIFTYLLVRSPQLGWENPRVKKGIRRGLQLLFIGYLLRMNIFGLLQGELYDGFFIVDVLHCIGISILSVVGIYLFSSNRKAWLMPTILVATTMALFLFEPLYKQWDLAFMPKAMANYFSKANGSVFTIFPWLGYATIGAFFSLLFTKYKNHKNLYPVAIIGSAIVGSLLLFYSSEGFIAIYHLTGIELFQLIERNNYLFIRLGDVLLVFALFMVVRKFLQQKTLLKIGASTLSIYVIHFIILYGSFTGLGLYRFFHHELPPYIVVPGAILFMISCTYLALQYNANEQQIKEHLHTTTNLIKRQAIVGLHRLEPVAKDFLTRVRLVFLRILGRVKGLR